MLVLSSFFFYFFVQSGPSVRGLAPFTVKVSIVASVNLSLIIPHENAQRFISLVILSPVIFTVKINHYSLMISSLILIIVSTFSGVPVPVNKQKLPNPGLRTKGADGISSCSVGKRLMSNPEQSSRGLV